MTTKEFVVKPLQIPDDGKKVILEYIIVKYTRSSFLSKTYVVDTEPKSHNECPVRHIHEFDTIEAKHPAPELALVPVAMCRDPLRLGKHKIVLCEPAYPDKRNKDVALDFSGVPLNIRLQINKRPENEYNIRKKCKEILDQVKEHEPWFGIEQEFYITHKNDIPLDWAHFQPSIDINSELTIGDHVGFERQFVDLHLRACIYAGLDMYGCVREMNPSQWEFQVGPLPGIEAADHVIFARYILLRLAEMHNVKISFRNIDCARGTNARQTFHLNFSTKKSREEGGLQTLYSIIDNISKYPQEAMFKYYDISNGEEMKWYLDGDFYMPLYHEFKYTIGDKHQSSIRIPTHVAAEGKGYIEERRPVSDADPYDVCRVFTVAALFDHKGNVLI